MKRDTILILEQDDASRKMLVDLFKNKYKILSAPDEKEGLELLRSHAQ